MSPKGAMLPYSLKRVPLDKDKEGQGSPLLGGTGSNKNPSAQAGRLPLPIQVGTDLVTHYRTSWEVTKSSYRTTAQIII